jgi:hypothetical protein
MRAYNRQKGQEEDENKINNLAEASTKINKR